MQIKFAEYKGRRNLIWKIASKAEPFIRRFQNKI